MSDSYEFLKGHKDETGEWHLHADSPEWCQCKSGSGETAPTWQPLTDAEQLSADCLLFAATVEQHGTPWASGCARVLREAACQLRELHGRLAVQREARQ